MKDDDRKLKSVLVVREHFRQELALRPFLEENGTIRCEILESAEPYYLRLKVALHYEQESVPAEILLPHDAVLLILIDAPEKSLGFATVATKS
jgi:hypothetical protein